MEVSRENARGTAQSIAWRMREWNRLSKVPGCRQSAYNVKCEIDVMLLTFDLLGLNHEVYFKGSDAIREYDYIEMEGESFYA